MKERDDCPLCQNGKLEYLNKPGPLESIKLCGRETVQVTPQREMEVSLEYLKGRLEKLGEASYLGSLLKFRVDEYELIVFPDGRAFINGCSDEEIAKSLYAKYVGA